MSKFRHLKNGVTAILLFALIFVGFAPIAAENLHIARQIEAQTAVTTTSEDSEPTKPEPTKPEPTKPEPTKPEPTPSETKPEPTPSETKPEPTKPEPTPSETKPEPTKPEPTKPEPTKPEPTKPEPTKPEPTKPEPTKPEPTKPEPTKPVKKHSLKVKIEGDGQGTVRHNGGSGAGDFEIEENAVPVFRIMPGKDDNFESITVNNEDKSNAVEEKTDKDGNAYLSLELEPVSGDLEVVVNFSKMTVVDLDPKELNTEYYTFTYSKDPLRVYKENGEQVVVMEKGSKVFLEPAARYTKINASGENFVPKKWPKSKLTIDQNVALNQIRLHTGLLGLKSKISVNVKIRIVFDDKAPTVKITPPENASGNYFNQDFTVKMHAEDSGYPSGIKEVTYSVVTEGTETRGGTIYLYDPEGSDEKIYHLESDMTIQSNINKGNGTVRVEVTDFAGNVGKAEYEFNINKEATRISAVDKTDKKAGAEAGYFADRYVAEITFSEVNRYFSEEHAIAAITVRKTDGEGNTVDFDVRDHVYDWHHDKSEHSVKLRFDNEGHYEWNIHYTNPYGVKSEPLTASADLTLEPTVDYTAPSGTIGFADRIFDDFISRLIYGDWLKDGLKIEAKGEDNLSPLKPIEYYVFDAPNRAPTLRDVEKLYSDGEFTTEKPVIGPEDRKLLLAARIADYAGNYKYISTNGIMIDTFQPDVRITTTTEANEYGFYNRDIKYIIQVSDKPEGAPYASGVDKVLMEVYDNGKQSVSKYIFEDTSKYETNPRDNIYFKFDQYMLVSERHNFDDVELRITAWDRAGNEKTISEHYKINIDRPEIEVDLDGEPVNVVGEHGYYTDVRKATIKVHDRNGVFDPVKASQAIQITAVDSQGAAVAVDRDSIIGEWVGEDTLHETVLTFNRDAGYTLNIDYTNLAGNRAENVTYTGETPTSFTVDREKPSGVLRLNDKEWSEMIADPDVNMIGNEPLRVTAEYHDATSPVTAEYFKDRESRILTETELEKMPFKPFREFVIEKDDRFTLYLRIRDAAGHTVYLSAGTYILDRQKPVIAQVNGSGNKNKIYNKDVELNLSITDADPSSGLDTVEYRIEADGKVTQSARFFSFDGSDTSLNDLVTSLDRTLLIEALKNNSNHVVVYITAKDRAGNSVTEQFTYAFDVTPPQVFLSFDNNDDSFNESYFVKPRTATLTVIERSENFNAKQTADNIHIIASDAAGNVMTQDKRILGEWKTTEGKTPDEARHVMTIPFDQDARYRLSVSVVDKAGNRNEGIDTGNAAAPFLFTIDTTAPAAEVTSKTKEGIERKRDSLIPQLVFDVLSRQGISVRVNAADKISDIHSIEYHISEASAALSVRDLEQIEMWQTYKPFELSENGQFTVYFKVVDKAGNLEYISTDGMMIDSVSPRTERLAPVVTANPKQPVNGIYRGDVRVDVKVIDPVIGNSASGLKSVRYRIITDGRTTQEEVLYAYTGDKVIKDKLRNVYSGRILVKSALNNSNNVRVEIFATDHAGNTSTDKVVLKIDTTVPKIHVSYNNNSVDNGKYFKDERLATIRITERNFSPADVRLRMTNSGGAVPQLSDWTTARGGGNGDGTVHSATVRFAADGDYTFDLSYTDRAGNTASGVTFAAGTANAKSFTVDRTKPEVSVVYDNNNVANGKYFKARRTATVTIFERNFDVQRVQVRRTGEIDNRKITLPEISWSRNGDSHTAVLKYDKDGDYTFDISVTDAAGNEASGISYGNSAAERAFTIDTTIGEPEIGGVRDGASYNGAVNLSLSFNDINFDRIEYKLLQTRLDAKNVDVTDKLMKNTTMTAVGGKGTYANFAEIPENDGMYQLNVKLIDKAGNTAEKNLRFSVNRFGSVYVYDDYLVGLKDAYLRSIDNELVITEYNADRLVRDSVLILITRDGEPLNDMDYEIVSGDGKPGNSGWYEYEYRIAESNFVSDGIYRVSVSSRDEAGNTPDSLTSEEGEILFRIDRTAPEITSVKGLEETIVNAAEQNVEFEVFDAMGLKEITVYADGESVAKFDNPEDLIRFSGAFTLQEGSNQHVRIVAEDLAGNITDTDAVDGDGKYLFAPDFDFNRTITVSTNFFIRWYVNRPAFYGSIGGILVLLLGLIGAYASKNKKEKV